MHVGLIVFNDVDYGIDLANVMDGIGLKVTLYLSKKYVSLHMGTEDDPIGRMHERGLLPSSCSAKVADMPRIRNPRSLLIIWDIVRDLYAEGVDVAHILMGPGELWLAVLALMVREIPVVSTMIIPKPNIGDALLPNWVVIGLHRLLVIGSDIIIVNGSDQVPLIEDLYRASRDRVFHVPLCPRLSFSQRTDKHVHEVPGTVLFFGAARPHKGLEYLIRAQPIISGSVPEARFLIASRGEELDRCRELIRDTSAFEIREGFIPGDEAATLFQESALVVLPYLSASTSGVLMTAYVFGKPVVASRVGSLPEYVIEDVTGRLVPPRNEYRLAAAVIDLLSNDQLRYDLGGNALEWAKKEGERVALRTKQAYERALSMGENRTG